ncbi:MAG: endo-1,4-beta-xylanase, partial [Lentisphaerae bacterium]|nr:endo-1,4-beta-xylanase [Lentisphaerota bacterium]
MIDEFSDAGISRPIACNSEDAVLSAIESGGGMERFFKVSDKVIKRRDAEVEGFPFSKSFILSIDEKPSLYWDRSFRLRNTETIKKGESLLAVFWARGEKAPQIVDDGAGATLQAYFHSSIGKYHKGRVNNFYDCKMLSKEWKRYYVKTTPVEMDFPPGTLSFTGIFGHKAQTIEVGGLLILAFPEGADISQIARPDWNYPGRASDAMWRREAERRIEKYRKGNLEIKVSDENGKPVSSADVRIKQRSHAFRFGTAVRVYAFFGSNKADVEQYRFVTTNYYNSVVLENELKWVHFESDRNDGWQKTKDCMSFYKNAGMSVRGHVLVWPTVYRTPEKFHASFREHPVIMRSTVLELIAE